MRCFLQSATSCRTVLITRFVTSDFECCKISGLILASQCHVAALSFAVMTGCGFCSPWIGVSWDEVWLMSDLSWVPRRDFCQHLQSYGHQSGSDVPLDATRRLDGTSVPGSASVHFWELLLQFGPLGTSKLEQRQSVASPTLPSQLDSRGQASSQIRHPSQAAGVWYSPPLSLSLIYWHTTAIRKRGRSNWGCLAVNMCHWPGLASSWQSPSLELGAHHCPYAKVP